MIVIIDYGTGNLHSIQRKFEKLGVQSVVSSDPAIILSAEKLILPGVGHFSEAMDNLKSKGLTELLNEAVLLKGIPILGICLGMQLMTESSEEGNVIGLGWFNCKTVKLKVNDPHKFKLPHTGWNTLRADHQDPILENIADESECYFVHKYGVKEAPAEIILTTTVHETPFISSLRKGHIVGMQFHPEKSNQTGLQLLRNFLAL